MSIYTPSIPQPPALPMNDQVQILGNFGILNTIFGVNHIPFGNVVSTAISTGVITEIRSTNHRLTTGDSVTFNLVRGVSGDSVVPWGINGSPFTVTVITPNRFTVVYNSSNEFPYIANSGDYTVAGSYPYGYHTQVSLAQPLTTQTPAPGLQSVLYSKYRADGLTIDLAYKNGTVASLEKILTNVVSTPATNAGQGFVTPWGLIVNLGSFTVTQANVGNFRFPSPFTSPPQTIIATGTNNGSITPGNVQPYFGTVTATGTQILGGLVGSNYWYFAMGF